MLLPSSPAAASGPRCHRPHPRPHPCPQQRRHPCHCHACLCMCTPSSHVVVSVWAVVVSNAWWVEAWGGTVDCLAAAPTVLWSVGLSRRWWWSGTLGKFQVSKKVKKNRKKLTECSGKSVWREAAAVLAIPVWVQKCRYVSKAKDERRKKNSLGVENTWHDGDIESRCTTRRQHLAPKGSGWGQRYTHCHSCMLFLRVILVEREGDPERGREEEGGWEWECSNSNMTVKWHMNFHMPQIKPSWALFFLSRFCIEDVS